MYRKLVNSLYILNIVFQAFFTLVFPIGIAIAVSWYLVEKKSFESWIYVVLIMPSVFIGLYSMIKFILSACRTLDNLEKEQKERDKNRGKDNQDG